MLLQCLLAAAGASCNSSSSRCSSSSNVIVTVQCANSGSCSLLGTATVAAKSCRRVLQKQQQQRFHGVCKMCHSGSCSLLGTATVLASCCRQVLQEQRYLLSSSAKRTGIVNLWCVGASHPLQDASIIAVTACRSTVVELHCGPRNAEKFKTRTPAVTSPVKLLPSLELYQVFLILMLLTRKGVQRQGMCRQTCDATC
jgi:hypothetical protein